jgi:hypothetical protein
MRRKNAQYSRGHFDIRLFKADWMLNDWNRSFPACEPIGHQMRVKFPDRWVRFHSLPDSKRYPENEGEYAVLLERFNVILKALSRQAERVVLLTTDYSESPAPVRSQAELQALDPTAVPWRTVAMHELDENFAAPCYWHVFASNRDSLPGAFDPVVRLVADDALRNIMIVAPDCRWLLHPYDGGMDVIAESQPARDLLKARYRTWLSASVDEL